MSKFSDLPQAASYYLACKAPSIGHKEGSDACDKYIKCFAVNSKVFYNERDSNQIKLASPEKIYFKLKDEKKKNYLNFWLEGGKLKTLVDSSLQDNGMNSIGKPTEAIKSTKSTEPRESIDWPGFYQSLGVGVTVKEFDNSEMWISTHGSNTTTTTSSKVVSK